MCDSGQFNIIVNGAIVAKKVPCRSSVAFNCDVCDETCYITVDKAEPDAVWMLESEDPYRVLCCSKCGYSRETDFTPPYCEYCGAKMAVSREALTTEFGSSIIK